MTDDYFFIDDILERTFIEAYNVARQNCSDDDAAVKIGMAIDGILYLTDEYAQQNILVLKGYKNLFVRLVHAEVYAALLAGAVTVDELFGLEFDERITDSSYDDMLTSYFVSLLMHYIEVLHVKTDINLTDDEMALVREVCPWYKLGGRK